MTYDRIYIARKDYQRAANDISQFLKDFHINDDYVNHWPYIQSMFSNGVDFPAIGFWHTSVSDNPFSGAWNRETETYDPPDWNEIYDMYNKLDQVSEASHD